MRLMTLMRDKISKFYNDDEKMFRIGMGAKFLGVSVFCTASVLLFTYLLIRIDLILFVTLGVSGAHDFQDAFVDFIYSAFFDKLVWVVLSAFFIFILGYYISGVILRPFKVIGQYCEDRMNGKNCEYIPDVFSDLRLLTTFSVFFFSKVDEAKTKGHLGDVETPSQFMGIHKPSFERGFFFNYLFIIVIFALLSSLAIIVLNIDFRDQIFALSKKFLGNNAQVIYFLNEQFIIANIAVYFFITFHLIIYFFLGSYLYSKVAAPAFAVFATMRSFLRGNYHSRVHLIGYYYLRNDCRKINKYLDSIQKNLT